MSSTRTNGLTIRGAAAWITATVLVWLVGAVASAVLPLLLVKRAVRSRRSDAGSGVNDLGACS